MKGSFAWTGVLVVSSLALPSARAATIEREYLSHGVANCQPALSTYDASLRRKPMGIQNTGTKPVYLTCDFDIGPNWPGYGSTVGFRRIDVAFLNASRTDVEVKCSLISGILEVPTTDLSVTNPVPGRDIVSLQTCIENYGDYWTEGPNWFVRYVVRADKVS